MCVCVRLARPGQCKARKVNTELPQEKMFFLSNNAFQRALALLWEPLLKGLRGFHRIELQRQNLHKRNIGSNADSMQTLTSPQLTMLPGQIESCSAAHLNEFVKKTKFTSRRMHDLTILSKLRYNYKPSLISACL